jgi:hypothetical protein
MSFPIVHRTVFAWALVAPMLLGACSAPPVQPHPPAAHPAPPPAPPVVPVEAEPAAPATQPAIAFIASTSGPVAAMLAYADKVRPLGPPELAAEINRLGEPGESPMAQMQLAMALAQTRVPADLVRATALMQKVASGTTPEALQLQPLARLLAARYNEQRRVEDEREKQAQQLRDSQRRIDQLTDRIEALRAIERSFSRPSHSAPAAPPAPANGTKAAP